MRAKSTTAPSAAAPYLVTDPLEDIREFAAACDTHAAALGHAVRELHMKIAEARMKNNGRGPSGLMITSVLERCWASYSAGTCLRSTRGPLAKQRTFEGQIAAWEPLLRPAPDPISVMHAGSPPSSSPPPSRAPTPPATAA